MLARAAAHDVAVSGRGTRDVDFWVGQYACVARWRDGAWRFACSCKDQRERLCKHLVAGVLLAGEEPRPEQREAAPEASVPAWLRDAYGANFEQRAEADAERAALGGDARLTAWHRDVDATYDTLAHADRAALEAETWRIAGTSREALTLVQRVAGDPRPGDGRGAATSVADAVAKLGALDVGALRWVVVRCAVSAGGVS